MTLYLQMDGIDDVLDSPSMAYTDVIVVASFNHKNATSQMYIDMRPTIANLYLIRSATNNYDNKGAAAATWTWDDVSIPGSAVTIPSNVKGTIKYSYTTARTSVINFLHQNGAGAQWLEGKVYDIKIYNGVTLMAWYDMTTGTVNDQSGNGRHATLVGGTWLDDGVGGGTDGSTVFDLKQVIYSDASVTADTKQSLYADGSTQHDLRQSLYEILSTVIDTKQVIYEDSTTAFDMLQEIFNDGMIGATHFDMRIQLYADDSTVFDNKQSWYEDGLNRFDLEQAIYEAGQSQQDMKLVIYEDGSTKSDMVQQIYSDSYTLFDTKQTMFNADTQLIGTINLKGSRKLYVYLKGSRILDIKLKGSRMIDINLKGRVGMTEINQNFSMYAGDSHIIKVPITSDVPVESGVTVKWALKKKNYSTVSDISKATGAGITIENGEVHIKLVPDDTQTLSGTYYHECEITDAVGNVSTIFEGLVTIKKSGV